MAAAAAKRRNAARTPTVATPLARPILFLVVATLVVAVSDDRRARGEMPRDSAMAHENMEAMVRDDPASMWSTYSPSAQSIRGGDKAAYVALMLQGTHPQHGRPNPFRLIAALPLEDSLTLLYYQVDV